MAKRDWLSRKDRLRVAALAIEWLRGEETDAERFGCACVVIERYLVDGGPKTMKLHAPKKARKPKIGAVVVSLFPRGRK